MAALTVLGYLANEPERLACALHELRSTLTTPPDCHGHGVAHFVDDRLLLNTRPSPVTTGTSVEELVGPLKTSTLLVNVHTDGDGGPYKFRSWAFSLQGSAGRAEARTRLMERLPDFLLRNISSDSLGEAAFHRFLSFLHEDHKVDDPMVDGPTVVRAMRQTLEMMAPAGEERAGPLCLVATNGRLLVCAHKGGGVAYSLREGILACQRCQMDRHVLDSFPVRESHRRFRGVVLVGGMAQTPTGFITVPDNKSVLITRKLDVQLV
ncbi:MAG: hypothetical protein AB2A00_17375 [Myxococcota bacterium]